MTLEKDAVIDQHSIGQSLLLHLLPGVLIGTSYFVFISTFTNLGYPSIMSLMVSVLIVLVPFEFGYLLYQGYKKNKKLLLKGIISYQEKVSWWQYLLIVPIVFVIIGLIFTTMKPLDQYLQHNIFAWMPRMDSGLSEEYSKEVLIKTYIAVAILGTIVGPIVEELYFRGYLLPRMKYAGRWAPLLHSFLFALYHIFTPWMIVTRTIGMIPLVYTIRKKNIWIGIIIHVLINSIDVITAIVFISKIK